MAIEKEITVCSVTIRSIYVPNSFYLRIKRDCASLCMFNEGKQVGAFVSNANDLHELGQTLIEMFPKKTKGE